MKRIGVPLAERDLRTGEIICECGKRFGGPISYAKHWEKVHCPRPSNRPEGRR